MTSIPGTDLTTEAARNRAARMLNEHDAALLVALADAYDEAAAGWVDAMNTNMHTAYESAVRVAKSVADRDKYIPQESAAAWDVVDALQTLRTSGETVTDDLNQDDHDGKQISRAAEWVAERDDNCG